MWNQYDPGCSRDLITERAWRVWWWCLLEVMTFDRGSMCHGRSCGRTCQAFTLPSKAYNWVPLLFSRRAQANSAGFHDSSAKDKEQAPTHVQTLQIIIMRVSASGESPKTASRPFFFSRSSNSNRPLFPTSNGTYGSRGRRANAHQKASIGEEVFRGITPVMLLH
jgi:hypothetical protein